MRKKYIGMLKANGIISATDCDYVRLEIDLRYKKAVVDQVIFSF